MKVLFFLQNAWFRNPEKALKLKERDLERWQKFHREALFNSHTGKIITSQILEPLWSYLGEDDTPVELFWENASPQLGDESEAKFIADPVHMQDVLDEIQPELVVVLGLEAAKGLFKTNWNGPVVSGPHPAARLADKSTQFLRIAEEVAIAILKAGVVYDRGISKTTVHPALSGEQTS